MTSTYDLCPVEIWYTEHNRWDLLSTEWNTWDWMNANFWNSSWIWYRGKTRLLSFRTSEPIIVDVKDGSARAQLSELRLVSRGAGMPIIRRTAPGHRASSPRASRSQAFLHLDLTARRFERICLAICNFLPFSLNVGDFLNLSRSP